MVATVICAGGAAILLGTAFSLEKQSERVAHATKQVRLDRIAVAGPASDKASDSTFAAPQADRHLEDLRSIFQAAAQQDVRIVMTDVDRHDALVGGYAVRRVTLRMSEQYPVFKAYLAALLEQAPHAYVSELRLERPDPSATRVNVNLGLSFVYAEVRQPTRNEGRAP